MVSIRFREMRPKTSGYALRLLSAKPRARASRPNPHLGLGQGQGSKLPKATRITHAARKVSQNRRTSSSGLW